MHPFTIEIRKGSRDEDRADFFKTQFGFVAVLADGAGGTGGGAEAASEVCRRVGEVSGSRGILWASFLAKMDLVLTKSRFGGLTTGVVVEVSDGVLTGASVGDSGACLFVDGATNDLTNGQRRKPLLGSGSSQPIPFGPVPFHGRLLLASDGILKYVPPTKIAEIVGQGDLQCSALSLVEEAKLPNGAFHDDVAVLLVDSILRNTH